MARHRIFVGKDVHKFSSAHMTVFPDGSKERIHGHNFNVSIAFDLHTTALSAFLDFAEVKRCLVERCHAWDQRLLLAEHCPHFERISETHDSFEFKLCGKRYVIPRDEVTVLPLENVVVETLAEAFAFEMVKALGSHLKREVVESLTVTLTESEGQGGIYRWAWNERAS